MSSDRSSDRKQQNALDALSSLASGEEPLAPAEPEAPPAQPPSVDPVVDIPKVPTRPAKPAAGSGRPDTPPAVQKAAKATPARAVSRAAAAAPAKAKPRAAAAAPTRRGRRVDPVKLRRRIAGMKQAEAWRQTAFPILVTIGLILMALGIVGLSLMPGESYNPDDDTDHWDVDPHSQLSKSGVKALVYASFPIGAVVIFGGILLVVQAARLKNLRIADEQILEPPEEEAV